MYKEYIQISNRRIGKTYPPFIVAEMSGNHNQSLDRCLKIVEAAAKAGAHALKIQTYTPDTMTLNLAEGEFWIEDPHSLWKGQSLYQLYQQAYTPWEWHEAIFKKCEELGLIGFSTPFDETAVDFLESFHVPCYKISSFENTDIALIRKIASTGKPLIISTGMASVGDLELAVQEACLAGCKDIILLKCTSTYPANPEDSNIRTIPHMGELFNVQVGLSDHTLGIGVALASIAYGATVIEKHFTLSRTEGGVDGAFSIEPAELEMLVRESENVWRCLGDIHYGLTDNEKRSLKFRRSLYVVRDMKAGEIFTKDNLRAIRPGYGLSPKHYEVLLGKQVKRDVSIGTPVVWDLIQ
jgi:pseudaminic acid synthase